MSEKKSRRERKSESLRSGFSTGTAAVAASIAALRHLLTGKAPKEVAVRLPSGDYFPVPILRCGTGKGFAKASVIKDGGDDPDITNRAEIAAKVEIVTGNATARQGIFLTAGKGVGIVTKPGLPVSPGEPAINPVPRKMFSENLLETLLTLWPASPLPISDCGNPASTTLPSSTVFLPFEGPLTEIDSISIRVTVEVPRGEELARHTLNPRLGILGGISILGTTGLVKPFSHEAYEETISSALSVAVSNGCETAILSTGGKSERFAQDLLTGEPTEAFVQVADFFAFSVREARRFGLTRIVHSVFFGKAVKMAQGYEYTHAHKASLDLELLAGIAKGLGCDDDFGGELANANTARHALEIITARGILEIFGAVAERALAQSARFAGEGVSLRLLLFDYEGNLLSDVSLQS